MNLFNHDKDAVDLCQPLDYNHKYWIHMQSLFNWKHLLCANRIKGSMCRVSSKEVLKFILQILSDKQLLPEYNLTFVFFLGNILNYFTFWAQRMHRLQIPFPLKEII